jgi:hypothetical protein
MASTLGTVRFSQFFTDRSGKVLQAIDRAKRKTYSKAGAYVRQAARSSIRPGKGPSAPGKPPKSHDGTLRRGILFGYDRGRDEVIVGPRLDLAKRSINNGQTVPEVIEFGGKVKDRETGEQLSYRARPFMGPALEREAPNFAELWSNTVREG